MAMKLSRRAFFPAAAGGVAAGPKLAQSALQQGAAEMMGKQPSGYGLAGSPKETTGIKVEEHAKWLQRRREKLEREALGEFDDDQYASLEGSGRHAGDPGLDNIDALRSVSMAGKRHMANDLITRRNRESRMRHAALELKSILAQLGVKV